jgi:hypothetical protein
MTPRSWVLLSLVAGALIVAWLGWQMSAERSPGVAPEQGTSVAGDSEPPTKTVTEAVEIFKRAFWRRPVPEDEILHAERQEWSDAEGLQRWRWFLVVKASPALIKNLREENAFGLVPSEPVPPPGDAPGWFTFQAGDFELLQSLDSSMHLFFSKNDNTLYATAAGRGFTRGAPEALPPAQGVQSPGRLPTTSPPNPES